MKTKKTKKIAKPLGSKPKISKKIAKIKSVVNKKTKVFESARAIVPKVKVRAVVDKLVEQSPNHNFNIEHLLIDEQVIYPTNQVELAQVEQVKAASLKELDKIIMGAVADEQVKNYQLKGSNSIRISFNQNNNAIVDRHLVNLKQETEAVVPSKTSQANLLKEFKVQNDTLEIPQAGFLANLNLPLFKQKLVKLFYKKEVTPKVERVVKEKALPNYQKLDSLKLALNFALVALLIIVPIKGLFYYQQVIKTKGKVLGATETAVQNINTAVEAVKNADWTSASVGFSQANHDFAEAESALGSYNQTYLQFVQSLPIAGAKISGGQNLLKAGDLISKAATDFSLALAENGQPKIAASLPDTFLNLSQNLNSALNDLTQALNLIGQINAAVLPAEYQPQFNAIKGNLPQMMTSLEKIKKLLDFTLPFLGYDQPKRYYFINQNDHELRAGGGFMGSMALVDINKGKIEKITVPAGGLYDLDGTFYQKIIAPEAYRIMGSAWKPWNANYWPDWPTNAAKLQWFMEHSNWPTADGIIAINSSVLEKILAVIGPIDLPNYGLHLTTDNVISALQQEVEDPMHQKDKQPKKIIGELMPIVIQKLMSVSSDQLTPLLLNLSTSLQQKDIQMYFSDPAQEQLATDFGWTGQIKQTDQDYLMVIRDNIAGGKTDGVIKQEISHYSDVSADGTVIDTVAVKLTHQGNPNDQFEKLQNNSFIRIYTPLGSKLINVSGNDTMDPALFKPVDQGFVDDSDLVNISGYVATDSKTGIEINNEFNKTVYSAWLQLKPGITKTLTISYQLPFKLNIGNVSTLNKFLNLIGLKQYQQTDSYSLLVQNQSGAKNSTFESSLNLPANLKINWSGSSTGNLTTVDAGLKFTADLNQDLTYGALLVK